MPEGQEPVADEAEQFEPVWVRPADALARYEAGQFFMIFPTIRTLQRLAQFASTQAVLDAVAHEQPLWVSCPRAGLLAGKEARYMEDDMPFGELALVFAIRGFCWFLPKAYELARDHKPGLFTWTYPANRNLLARIKWAPNIIWGAIMAGALLATLYYVSRLPPFIYLGF